MANHLIPLIVPKASSDHTRNPTTQIGQVLKERGQYVGGNIVISCPHCATNCLFTCSNYSEFSPARVQKDGPIVSLRVHSAQCPICLCLVIGIVERDGRGHEHIWPADIWPDHAPHDLEVEIKHSYDDARKVLPLSPMSAAVMARRAIQHIIRTKLGIKKNTLFEEIKIAILREELGKTTKESLAHVKDIGNWGAHPSLNEADILIEIEEAEAIYTLEVVELLFEDLYLKPARQQKMNKRLAEIKKGIV